MADGQLRIVRQFWGISQLFNIFNISPTGCSPSSLNRIRNESRNDPMVVPASVQLGVVGWAVHLPKRPPPAFSVQQGVAGAGGAISGPL